jgi:hypothetical protein
MTDEGQERRWEEGPRVRVRPRPGRRAEPVRVVIGEVRDALRGLERHFLAVQAGAETREAAELLTEYLTLLNQLRGLDQRLEAAAGRRDLQYGVHLRFLYLNDNCRWLARRILAEMVLTLQVHLEQRFRRLVDPDVYQMFLRLDELADTGREIESMPDRELMSRLRDGTLVRDVLEAVRLADVVAWPPQGPPPR